MPERLLKWALNTLAQSMTAKNIPIVDWVVSNSIFDMGPLIGGTLALTLVIHCATRSF